MKRDNHFKEEQKVLIATRKCLSEKKLNLLNRL